MTLKEQILNNLKNNGFPNNKVSLPLEKMNKVAKNNGENLNHILDQLKDQGIEHDKTIDKIIFKTTSNLNNPEAIKKAQEMMNEMDPEEMKKLQEHVSQMSDEERNKLMEQAKAMGLF